MTDPYGTAKRRLSERHAVGVAMGVLVQTRECTDAEAFEFLTRTSVACGLGVVELSTLVIQIGTIRPAKGVPAP